MEQVPLVTGPRQTELDADEALVLYHWLRQFNELPERQEDTAEQRVLWALECVLETKLAEPFMPEYATLVARAKERIMAPG
ncbi:MAG TPA: hypothetical protein VK427_11230 [Kofleriaceae bacterium]|nr:hypothetical protein [Kofleriaceae bacterium]